MVWNTFSFHDDDQCLINWSPVECCFSLVQCVRGRSSDLEWDVIQRVTMETKTEGGVVDGVASTVGFKYPSSPLTTSVMS